MRKKKREMYFWVMLRGFVNNQVKESFYRQRKKNQSMLWQFFFISYKSDMKTFLRLLTNSLKSLVSISLYLKKKKQKTKNKTKATCEAGIWVEDCIYKRWNKRGGILIVTRIKKIKKK